MKYNIYIFFIVNFVIPIIINAQSQLELDAQIRNRFELRDGYRSLATKGATPAVLIWQRTRLTISYETDNIRLKITPQDVRLWGDEQNSSSTGVFGDAASLELFEGYVDIKLRNMGWVTVGRQQFKYNNQRILAARNWNNNGLTYDAVLFKLKTKKWNIHLGSTWNNYIEASSENLYPSNRIKSYNFLWLNRKLINKLNLSLLHVASGVAETDSTTTLNYRQTTGFYSEYKNDGMSIWGDAYYQYGKNKAGTNVSAFLLGADASYKIKNFKPGIGFEYLSGNSKIGAEQTTDNLFDILYGARHKYLGYIDYFRNFSTHTNQGGVVDYYFYLDYKFSKSLSICNIGHYFQLSKTNSTTPDDKNLGYENDLVLNYKFNDWGVLEIGYMFILPTETLKTLQNVTNNKFSQFFYIQLTLSPMLFKQ